MSGEIRCPKCGSKDVTCSENPHNHVCHACGYSMLPTGDVSALDDIIDAALAPMDEAENRYFGITVAEPLDTEAAYPRLEAMARAVLSVPALRDALARDAQVRDIAPDAVWMAKLARGGSWPGEMAERVERAANRVITALGDDADRAALDAVASMLRDGKG